jgi:hypothetical protein
MSNIGKIIKEDIDEYIIEDVKSKTHINLKKIDAYQFEVNNYIAYSSKDSEPRQVYKYHSLSSKNIITEEEDFQELIILSKPFHIAGCLSEKEAELGFNELIQKSSCNFVKNLKYIENEEDGHYDVTGDIGLYYREAFTTDVYAEKFNEKFKNDVEIVRMNLDHELEILEKEKMVIKASHHALKFSMILVSLLILFGMIFKH